MANTELGLQLHFSMRSIDSDGVEFEVSDDEMETAFDYAFHIAASMCNIYVNQTNHLGQWQFFKPKKGEEEHLVRVEVDTTEINKRTLVQIIRKFEMMVNVFAEMTGSMHEITVLLEETTHVTAKREASE